MQQIVIVGRHKWSQVTIGWQSSDCRPTGRWPVDSGTTLCKSQNPENLQLMEEKNITWLFQKKKKINWQEILKIGYRRKKYYNLVSTGIKTKQKQIAWQEKWPKPFKMSTDGPLFCLTWPIWSPWPSVDSLLVESDWAIPHINHIFVTDALALRKSAVHSSICIAGRKLGIWKYPLDYYLCHMIQYDRKLLFVIYWSLSLSLFLPLPQKIFFFQKRPEQACLMAYEDGEGSYQSAQIHTSFSIISW